MNTYKVNYKKGDNMDEWVNEVHNRARLGKPPVSGGRSNKLERISFDNLVFVPLQLTGKAVDYFREKVSTETILGKTSKHPIKLRMPIVVASMSFGALGKHAKIALAKAATMAGTLTGTGEGGMLPEEREHAKLLAVQYSTGRFGVDDEYLKAGNAVDFKIGQGAKPGQGGLLPAHKVTEEIAKVRRVPMGTDVHSPPRHLDINSIDELRDRIKEIKKTTGGKPIFLKLGAAHVEEDVKLAVEAKPDSIIIDGLEGGTGAAPRIMLDDFGIPALSALVRARKTLDELNAKQELIIAGGLNTGADVAKAIALGADAVAFGFPMMVALGCIYCKQCHLGKCPVGIATHDKELLKKLNIDEGAAKAANFLTACNEEVKMAAAATGKLNVHELCRDDLRSMDLLTREITGIPLV